MWDGGTARQLGLVDGFGGMGEAIAKAAELAKLGDERGVTYLERPESFRDEILAALPATTKAAPRPTPSVLLRPRRKPRSSRPSAKCGRSCRAVIQVRCLECPPVAPTRIVAADTGLFARLIGWLAS